MKKTIRNILLMICLMATTTFAACGKMSSTQIDYADAESFEAALNAGENLEGKVVQFVVGEVHPQSALGFNLWAGEHLNFVSNRNPDYKQGDTAVVRTTTIESNLGSWIIHYEKVENGVINERTTKNVSSEVNGEASSAQKNTESIEVSKLEDSNQTGSTSNSTTFSVGGTSAKETEKALEIKDYGCHSLQERGRCC